MNFMVIVRKIHLTFKNRVLIFIEKNYDKLFYGLSLYN